MSQNPHYSQYSAPCIVDCGILVNKEDMKRLLNDLGYVQYVHTIDNVIKGQGNGWIVEVFSDPSQSTLIANGNIYINVESFDFIELYKSPQQQVYFDLIQDNRKLRLFPCSHQQQDKLVVTDIDAAEIESMVVKVLSAKLDVELDEEGF